MKKLIAFLYLVFVLSGCFFDESNQDASAGYLTQSGIATEYETKSFSLAGIVPDSLKALRTSRILFDSSVSMVGRDSAVGVAVAGYGYTLTGFLKNLDSTAVDSLYAHSKIVIQLDTLFNQLSERVGDAHYQPSTMAFAYTVVLYKGATDADFLRGSVVTGGIDTLSNALFIRALMGDAAALQSPKAVYSRSFVQNADLVYNQRLVLQSATGAKDSIAYQNPYFMLTLDSAFTNSLKVYKDSSLHMALIITDAGSFNATDSSIVSLGIQRLRVDFPKPTLRLSSAVALSHSIDRYTVRRTFFESARDSLRIWAGLDTLSVSLPVDTILNRLEISVGPIQGAYAAYMVKRASIRFHKAALANRTEIEWPYTIDVAVQTYDNDAYGFSGYMAKENQFSEVTLRNLVTNLVSDSLIEVDVTEAVKNIVNLGRVGADPTIYFFIASPLYNPMLNYRIKTVENSTNGERDQIVDNRYNTLVYNSYDFTGLSFDMDIEFVNLGINQ